MSFEEVCVVVPPSPNSLLSASRRAVERRAFRGDFGNLLNQPGELLSVKALQQRDGLRPELRVFCQVLNRSYNLWRSL